MPSVVAFSVKGRSVARVLVPAGRASDISSSLDCAPPAGGRVSIPGHRGGVSPREPVMNAGEHITTWQQALSAYGAHLAEDSRIVR